MKNTVIGIEQILLADSYVLSFSRRGASIVISMDLTHVSGGLGNLTSGEIIFPDVYKEECYGSKGEPNSIESINEVSHRYFGGHDEKPDIGTIASIQLVHEGKWHVVGDWGECLLYTFSQPRVVFGVDAESGKGASGSEKWTS